VRFTPAISFLGLLPSEAAHDRLGTSEAVEFKRCHLHQLHTILDSGDPLYLGSSHSSRMDPDSTC